MSQAEPSLLIAHPSGQSGVDMERATASLGFRTTLVTDAAAMREHLTISDHGILLLDADLLAPDPTEILSEITSWRADLAVVVITDNPSMKSVVQALRGGACDYLVKPYRLDQLERCLQRAVGARERFMRHLQQVMSSEEAAN